VNPFGMRRATYEAAAQHIGKQYGRLTVLRIVRIGGRAGCVARCSCGSTPNKSYRLRRLIVGHTRSCSCLRRETCAEPQIRNVIRHGHCANGHISRTYSSWHAACRRCRCRNPKSSNYKYWGGRGIRVCARWLGRFGFSHFFEDMGERPAGRTLDRYPNRNGNYTKSNCRWATATQQATNIRKTKRKKAA
jgi:hypothetical protein